MKNKSVYQFLHDYFFEHLGIRKKASVKTIKAYKQSINEFRGYLKDYKQKSFLSLKLSDFNQDNVYDFLVYLRDIKGQKSSTLNLRLAALKSFMRYCGDEDPEVTTLYIALSKIQKFKDPERNGRVEYLTEEQLKLLFRIPDTSIKLGRRDRFIMIMLYETGARIEEFLSIRLSDIYRQENCVQVRLHGKGDKTRYIPLLDDVIPYLDDFLKEFHPDSTGREFLVYTVHQDKHTKMTEGTVNLLLKKYASVAAETDPLFPKDLHCHTMRHSIAMAMYKKGVPLTYIKDFLGHANLGSVSIYAHADNETVSEALEAANSDLEIHKDSAKRRWKGHEEELLAFCGLA